MINIIPKQLEEQLLNGEIDGVQIHKCLDNSFIKTFKDGKILNSYDGLHSQDKEINDFRQRCQSRHEEKDTSIFFDKKIDDYRCICFNRKNEKYCYLSKGVTANLNFCELFNMKSTWRKEVSLVDKTGGFLVSIPL